MVDVTFFSNHEEFIDWLEENHTEVSELWVGYYKKSTGRPSLTWSTSVDAALCFGWIDGKRKSIDEQSFKIRFTPRKLNSVWSAINVNKVETLMRLGKMKPTGLYMFNKRTDAQGYSVAQRSVQLTSEYEVKFRENRAAWLFFSNLAPSYKRDSIWWVMNAKTEEIRAKRLGILIACSEAELKIPSLRKK